MNHNYLKDILYASLTEILQNNGYYYYSALGNQYCQLSERGKEAVLEIVSIFGPKIIAHQEARLNERAKELMLNELKKTA
jgi:hypothetical protein